MPTRNLTWMFAAIVIAFVCHGEAKRNRYARSLSESIDRITEFYVEPVDPRVLFDGGMTGMLQQLDPYSGYIPPEDYQQFRVDIEQEFGGIGIEVGIENEKLTVLNPVPGKPAYEAGMMAGDTLITIDGQDVTDASLDEAVKLMRGEIGTEVTVEVLHIGAAATSTYKLRRAKIDIESIRGDRRDARGHWIFMLEDHPQIGYVRLTSFGEHTTSDLYDALTSLNDQVGGLILDLRGNAGGLLESAVDICDMFLSPDLVIVTTRGRDGQIVDEFRSQHPPLVNPSLPVVVLVDHFSASASEIVSACLQDHQRATIVGERTWGKGTVQNVIPLEGGKSAMRLTTQTYWRPSGENIHRHRDDGEEVAWGVSPAPENLVKLSSDEFRAVYLQRRQRDLAQRPVPPTAESEPAAAEADAASADAADNASGRGDQQEADATGDGAAPADESASAASDDGSLSPADQTPVVDRQLKRAIELLTP